MVNFKGGQVKVLFITSWNCACGIATYSKNLITSLENLGITVEVFSETKNFNSLTKLAKDSDADVVHIQHEFGISLTNDALLSLIGKFKRFGKKVVITPHTEDTIFNILVDGVADSIILHNDIDELSLKPTFSNFYRIPHGIPEVSFDNDKRYYRKKYGIPEDAFVVGTCGFISNERSKFIESLICDLIPFIKKNKNVYINLATSCHRSDQNGQYANRIRNYLLDIAKDNGFEDCFYMHTEFMETQEFRERLYTMDLGFAKMSKHVVSNSGAASDMVSCGVPVVINDVPHFSHIKKYAIIAEDVPEMVQAIENYYTGPRKDVSGATKELGFSQVAKKHYDIYHSSYTTKKQYKPKLTDKDLITVCMPNSLWQALLMWTKLDVPNPVRFVFQNDGKMATAILPYIIPLYDVQYADIGMVDDKRVARIQSKTLSANMMVDIERWLKEGNSFKDFIRPHKKYKPKLSEFAQNNAKKIKHDCIVNVSDVFIDQAKKKVTDNSLVISSPDKEVEARKMAYTLNVDICVTDTRSKWAACYGRKVVTELDDLGVYCLLNDIPAEFVYTYDWQRKLVDELRG
jgi:hypothetical protein